MAYILHTEAPIPARRLNIQKTDGKDEWITPPHIVQALGPFDLDPCSPAVHPFPFARRTISLPRDGLAEPWGADEFVWCNPPYGRETGRWLAKCESHGNAIALIFARTETKDWEKYVWSCAAGVCFLFGRLRFHHVDGRQAAASGGAPSALIAYGRAAESRIEAALDSGSIRGVLVQPAHMRRGSA